MQIKTVQTIGKVLKWIAQISGTLYIVTVAAFILGEVELEYIVPETTNPIPILSVLIQMIGIIIAWNNELVGASVITAGYLIFSHSCSNYLAAPSFPFAILAAVFFFATFLVKQNLEGIYQQL